MTGLAAGFGRLNPVTLWVEGLDWFGRSRRTPFALVFGIVTLCALVFVLGAALPRWATVVALLGAAGFFVPFLGHGMRRLNDLRWSGWWAWLLVVPGASVVLGLMLCLKRGRPVARQPHGGLRVIGFGLACIAAVLIAARVIWAPFTVNAEAMSPTLQAGDLIVANTAVRRFDRGDVVVFTHPIDGRPHVLRLIGLPGDRIQMREGRLFINDTPAAVSADGTFARPYEPRGPAGAYPRCANGVVGLGASCEQPRAIETLPGGASHATLDIGARSLDNTGVVVVPDDRYFLLGDNRDNASDSRLPRAVGGPGLVPRDDLVGRASLVILSATGASRWAVWTWRSDRILRRVT